MKKFLVVGIILGIMIFGLSNSGIEMNILEDMKYAEILCYIVFSMILTGISSFILYFCIGIYWSYSTLLRNSERTESGVF